MKKALLLALGSIFLWACDSGPLAPSDSAPVTGGALAGGEATARGLSSKPMVLRLLGTDDESLETVQDPNDLIPDDMASCYTVDLWDVTQDRIVGTAKDCISVIGTVGDDGVQVVGTTTFDFGGGHTFTTQGLTSVQPTTHGSPGSTHITGAIPASATDNGVIAGTGRYRNLEATARLSGAVNLSSFPASGTFDCLFVIHRI